MRRTFERADMGIVRLSVVHHDHRDTDWPAVFQVRQSGILSVWEGSCVRRWCGQPACQHRLADRVGDSDGSRQCRNRRCLLHYNHRNSIWQAVLQDRQAGSSAVRGNGELDSGIRGIKQERTEQVAAEVLTTRREKQLSRIISKQRNERIKLRKKTEKVNESLRSHISIGMWFFYVKSKM